MRTPDDRDFISTVSYFWLEKGDPTRYVHWDERRCEQLMPMFYAAWKTAQTHEQLANLAAKHYRDQLESDE